MYRNLTGSAAPAAARDQYVGLLDKGTFTQASLAQLAADLPLNAQSIDLVGLSTIGLAYTPLG